MKLTEWDANLQRFGEQLKRAKMNLTPHGEGLDEYSIDLEEQIRACENRIDRMNKRLEQACNQNKTASDQTKALFYWGNQYAETVRKIVSTSRRVGLKDLWLNIFKHRFMPSCPQFATPSEELHALLQVQSKAQEISQQLAEQHENLSAEMRRLEGVAHQFDTEVVNGEAVYCMQNSLDHTDSSEMRDLHELESYLRMVQFTAHKSRRYQHQARREIEKVESKCSKLMDKCSDLASNSLDFDTEGELVRRAKHINEYKDQLHLLEMKIEKIDQAFQGHKIQSLHPVLKKSGKQANTRGARKYQPRSIDELS